MNTNIVKEVNESIVEAVSVSMTKVKVTHILKMNKITPYESVQQKSDLLPPPNRPLMIIFFLLYQWCFDLTWFFLLTVAGFIFGCLLYWQKKIWFYFQFAISCIKFFDEFEINTLNIKFSFTGVGFIKIQLKCE